MEELVNPMKRLYDMLESVISYGVNEYASDTQITDNIDMRVIWNESMQIDLNEEEGLEEYHNSLTDLMRLIISCEQIVKNNPSMNQALYKSQLARIKRVAFSIGITNWGTFRREFNEDFLLALQWAIEGMNEHVSERLISDEDLKQMHSELQEIIDRVLASDLPLGLKTSLVDGLAAIQSAILEYRLYGAEGIRNAIDRNVGLVYRNLEEIGTLEQPESKNVARDAIGCIWKIDKFVSAASKVKELAQPLTEHFPMLGGG